VNRLTLSCALSAVALALLGGCSSDSATEAGTAASAAPTAPASAPVSVPAAPPKGSAPAAPKTGVAALCDQVTAAKTALNAQLKQVVGADGRVPPAQGRKVLTGLAATLTELAGTGKGKVPDALEALAAEATKAAGTADPVQAASGGSFEEAGVKVDNACADAAVTTGAK
jgi:hypothetical protein